jgi:hypothetical protein
MYTEEIQNWISSTGPYKSLLVLYTHGTGVGSEVYALAHAFETITISFDTVKAKELLLMTVQSRCTPFGKKKLLVLDGFEAIVNDSNLCNDCSSVLKKGIPIPVICLGHPSRTVQKKFKAMFPFPTKQTVVEADHGPDHITRDRRHMGILEEYNFHKKDIFYEAHEAFNKVIRGECRTPDDIYQACRFDSQVVSLGLYECHDGVSNPHVTDMYSLLDVMATGHYDETFTGYEYLSLVYPGMYHAPVKERKFGYGMLWSKTHIGLSKNKSMRPVKLEYYQATRHWIDVPLDCAFMRFMVNAEKFHMAHLLSSDSILKILRLWKCPSYARIKKALESN